MKSARIAEQAAALYNSGMAIEAVAKELGVAYRTARKAIFSKEVVLRDPSARLVGRTRPDKKVSNA
jgi:orotate phosphoribosyltransferase-like protein